MCQSIALCHGVHLQQHDGLAAADLTAPVAVALDPGNCCYPGEA
jgi:hypothetical protein